MSTDKKEGGYYKFFAALKPLSWKDRVDYIWTYYKWTLVIVFMVIVLVGPLFAGLHNSRIEQLYNGALANVMVTDEGEYYITDGWRDELGGHKKWSDCTLISSYFQSYEDSTDAVSEYNAIMTIVVRLLMGDLDYLIMDNYAMTYFISEGTFAPLGDVLPEEMLAQYEEKLVYAVNENDEQFPVAIDLTDTDFIKDNGISTDFVYIAFPENSHNAELNDEFLQYLFNWKS